MTPTLAHVLAAGLTARCPRCGERLRDLARRRDRRVGPMVYRGGVSGVVECPHGCVLADVEALQAQVYEARRRVAACEVGSLDVARGSLDVAQAALDEARGALVAALTRWEQADTWQAETRRALKALEERHG